MILKIKTCTQKDRSLKLQSYFYPNVNHLELLFNLIFLINVPILIPVTVFYLL